MTRGLLEDEVDPDPWAQMRAWVHEAEEAGAATDVAALATVSAGGSPSVRMVLIREWGPEGFLFCSDSGSRKGSDLAANPEAALMYHWPILGRQVRAEGIVTIQPTEVSESHFGSRPRGSKLSAAASRQSQLVGSRSALERAVEEMESSLGGGVVPRPDRWVAYLFSPSQFEFWQHRDNRLHDRIRYLPVPSGGWRRQRLQP